MQKYFESFIDSTGKPVAGAIVAVTTYPGGAVASIYQTNSTNIPIPNGQVVTNALGYFEFYAPDGRYTITITSPTTEPRIIPDVLIEDPADGLPEYSLPNGSSLVGFLQAGVGAVASTVQGELRDRVSVKQFGAIGDGVADDTLAIRRAVDAIRGVGGEVFFPPTGAAYRITDTIFVPNGVVLKGTMAKNFEGANGSNAQWTDVGTWINPTHATNPAFKLVGHGSGVIGFGFIHDQPIPSGGAWAPNTYGYCIEQNVSHSTIEDIQIVNASHGIWMNYSSASGGGTQVRWRDVVISAFAIRMRTTCVNDTAYLSNLHLRNLYYSSDSSVVAYLRANTIGWYCGYTDNIMVDGLEFFEEAISLYFADDTCLGNTHSLYNASISNMQFNLPQVCMKVQNGSTVVFANLVNTLSQTGNAFGYTWADTAFQLASDNVRMKFNGLTVNEAGGQLFALGNGAGGRLVISDFDVEGYSTVSAGQVCISAAAGSDIRLSNYRVVKGVTAGARFAGAGVMGLSSDASGETYFFGRYGEASVTCTGAAQDFSTDSAFRPSVARSHQIRIIGQLNVTTPQSGGVISIAISGVPGLSVTGINATTTGFKNFDSGWVDVAEALLQTDVGIGRLRVTGTSGVVVANGSVSAIYR